MEFPTALLGVALGTVLLPSLSAAHARADAHRYQALLDWGLKLTLLLGLPAALGMALLSDGLVATLFNYGKFSVADVEQTRVAVMAYSVGLVGMLAVKILAPGFYAKQDIRTPVKIAICVLIFTQVLNLVLVPRMAHAGLALAIGLAACANALALLWGLHKRGVYHFESGWLPFLTRISIALAAMGALLVWVDRNLDWYALGTYPWLRVGWLLATLLACGVVYFGVLLASGMRKRHLVRPG